jgi:serine/threonine protein kinase
MYSLQPLENGSTTSKYASLGRPQKMRLFTEQWKEGELVMPMQPHESLVGDTILLGDFGLARKAGTPVALKLQSPATYCAPERLHGVDPSFASDMWSYMCLFFELYTTACLFPGSGYTSVVSSMVNTLGPLPVSWKGTYYARAACDTAWYDQDRQLEPTTALKAKIMRLRPDISAMELELVMSILRQGLSYHPEHRLMAAQLLEDASFKALMGIYGF